MLVNACPLAGSWNAETLSLTSLHVSNEIHVFCLASLGLDFETAHRRSANASSSLIGSFASLRGKFFCPPRYLLCFVRETLGSQPSTMHWSELCRGSRTEKFPMRWRFVPRIESVWDCTSLPCQSMHHVLLSQHQRRRCVRKCDAMSSSPSVTSVAAISSSLWSPSGAAKFMLRSPATSSSAPLGCSLSASTTLSIVEVSLGEK